MKGGGEGGDETFFWYEDMSLCERLRAAKTAYFLDLRQRLNEKSVGAALDGRAKNLGTPPVCAPSLIFLPCC
jgi:hypothetical protein